MMHLRNEDLADLLDLLRLYGEVYPDESAVIKLQLSAMEHFREQTGTENITLYLKNRRQAGRKPKITEEQKMTVHGLHRSGATLQAIAEQTGLSIGTVYYVLHPSARK